MNKIPGYNDHKELSTERFRIRSARNNLRQTMDRYPSLIADMKAKREPPEYTVGYLKASVVAALRDLDLFAEDEPDFITW